MEAVVGERGECALSGGRDYHIRYHGCGAHRADDDDTETNAEIIMMRAKRNGKCVVSLLRSNAMPFCVHESEKRKDRTQGRAPVYATPNLFFEFS